MADLSLNCKGCKILVADSSCLAFYKCQTNDGVTLSIRLERKDVVNRFTKEKTKDKNLPYIFKCSNCDLKLGSASYFGVEEELIYSFKSGAIYLLRPHEHPFTPTKSNKWKDTYRDFPEIEYIDVKETKSLRVSTREFIPTVFPTQNQVKNFNITSFLADKPRSYQIELYNFALLSNSIIYLPTGAGKTMVAAMAALYFKKHNPQKKVFFVCDRIPLVYQQASYLRNQTNLNVGELCAENKSKKEFEMDKDIVVFTCDFLLNMLAFKKLQMEDCCCLIIDEIHHAVEGHSFTKLIQQYYFNVPDKYRARLIGLTASPSGKAVNFIDIQSRLDSLSDLIKGYVRMPIVYYNDFEAIINRPCLQFKIVEKISDNIQFQNDMNNFINHFLNRLNINLVIKIEKHLTSLKGYLNNLQVEHRNSSRYTLVQFLQKIVESYELVDILGMVKTVSRLNEIIIKQIKDNENNSIWSCDDIQIMTQYNNYFSRYSGESTKFETLKNLLMKKKSDSSRIIIFVKTRKTARYLCASLKEVEDIRNMWNPEIFVGHAGGSYEGMQWFGEQQEALQRFNNGKTKLLVSTNVLQEGLDVSICDKVIMFDPLITMTEFVQSRGRARHKHSEFIVIGTSKQKDLYENLVESEKNLICVLKTIKHLAIDQSEIREQIVIAEKTPCRQIYMGTTEKSHGEFYFTLQIYLLSNQDNHLNQLGDIIRGCKGLKQTDILKKTYNSTQFFEDISKTNSNLKVLNCLFEVKKNSEKVDPDKQVLEAINFILKQNLKIAIHRYTSKSSFRSIQNIEFLCSRIDFGNLATPFEFFLNKDSNTRIKSPLKFLIKHNLKIIVLLIFVDEDLYRFEIEFDSLDEIICIDEANNKVQFYIPLKRAPSIFVSEEKIQHSKLETLNDENIEWNRTSFDDLQYLTFKLEFELNHKLSLISNFQTINEVRVLFCSVSIRNPPYTFDDLKWDLEHNDFETRYYLEAFISQLSHMIFGKINNNFAKRLSSLEKETLMNVLEKLCLYLPSKRYLELNTILESVINELKDRKTKRTDFDSNLKIGLTRRVIITPTRIIYYFPEPNYSNRVTRKYGSEHFLRVKFRDENTEKLNNFNHNFCEMKNIYQKIYKVLINGLILCNRKYEFLAMSASQLRDHGCWFFRKSSDNNAQKVREWMGDFKEIKCIGKYAARLGQSLSSSIETIEIEEFHMIDDIEVYDPINEVTYCFTDGIGKISKEKALEICKNYYQIDYLASAFQIRYAGFKGVVALDPNMKDHHLAFRNSMKKFESGHNRLDVLNIANSIPCFLNRQVIMILSSLGVEDKAFSDLLEKMLNSLSVMLIDSLVASNFINIFYKSEISFSKNSLVFNYTYEPFFRDLLIIICKKMLQGLVKRSRIFVEKGRILMGTIDETGLLKEDQVFIQCNPTMFELNSDGSKFIVESKVMVAKNPCMHPGDIRVMNSVDIPDLRHMVDCIVFPSVGPRPITNMCSGSDLDGDLYFVSWEPSLIPNQVEEPMNYKSPPAKNSDEDITIEDVCKFFVNFMEMDRLGALANAHVAIADISSLAVKDPICIKLAEAFSLAVDFPKTGVVAEMPKEVKKLKYPDFMEKSGESYESQKIIGKMYRKCKKILIERNLMDTIELNPCFIIDGHENYLDEAKELYLNYRLELERILLYFNCKSESELFVNIYFDANQSDESQQFLKQSSKIIKNLWAFYRIEFFKSFKNELTDDQIYIKSLWQRKASAWYVACYSSELNNRIKIISFPWIVEDVMNSFDITNYDVFSKTLLEKFVVTSDDFQLVSRFTNNLAFRNDLNQMIEGNLVITGSSGLFLFEKSNEIQFLFISKSKWDPVKISNRLDESFYNVSLHGNIIKCEHDEETSFTVACSPNDLNRFIFIRLSIFKNPFLLPILFTITHLARLDNLLMILNGEKIKFDVFIESCVTFFIRKNYCEDVKTEEIETELNKILAGDYNSIDSLDEWQEIYDKIYSILDKPDYDNVGSKLLNFYKEMAYNTDEPLIESKFDDKKYHVSQNESVKNHFFKVFNLMTITNDINNIWDANLGRHEPSFKRFKFKKYKKLKDKTLFAPNCSLVLFSNFKSENDLIDFQLYNGNKRPYHMYKQCFIGINENQYSEFTNECYQSFYLHSLSQLNKARELKSDFQFKFHIKFGDFYFSSIPDLFINETTGTYLWKLREALEKTYTKEDKFIINTNKMVSLCSIADNENDEYEPGSYDSNISDGNNKPECDKNDRKRKKRSKGIASSSFDSSINNPEEVLHDLFKRNEFDSKIGTSYIVYLDHKKKSYRIKYDNDLNLVKVFTLPIKWLCVDVKNSCKTKKTRDIRFVLSSDKAFDEQEEQKNILNENENDILLEEIEKPVELKKTLMDRLKNGIIEKKDDEFIVKEDFLNSKVYFRKSEMIKYYGGYENWEPIFRMVNMKIPSDINYDLLEKIRVAVINSTEFVDNDKDGVFNIKNIQRKECFISLKPDINNLKQTECRNLINLLWFISQVFHHVLQ